MLEEYQSILSKVVCVHEDNDGVDGTDIPSFDASLRHALSVAMKVTKAANYKLQAKMMKDRQQVAKAQQKLIKTVQ